MKTIPVLLIFFSFITLSVLGQTPQSAVETDIAVIKTEIINLKENVNNGFNNVKKDLDNLEENFQIDLDNFQKNFDRQNNIIIACIGIPLAILAIFTTIWGILANKRSRKDQALEKQIEILTQEIETLKQQQIVRP